MSETRIRKTLADSAARRPVAPPDPSGLIYVYGVVQSVPDDFGTAAPIAGLDPDQPVRFVAGNGLVAVVSTVPKAVFAEAPFKEKLQDADWAKARMLDHHRVVMAMSETTLLPFKFGTVFADARALLRALDSHGEPLKSAFETVAGAREWGVKLFADANQLARYVVANDPGLAQLSRKAGKASAGTAFFLRRRVKDLAQTMAADTAQRWAQAILDGVAGAAKAAATQPLQSHDLHGRSTDMVLNATYLVPQKAELAFHRAVDAMARPYTGTGLDFEVIGPMPPYSFVTIEADPVPADGPRAAAGP